MKKSFFDKVLDRIDRLGPGEVQNYLQRLAGEKGFLETIFNTLQEGILVIDPEGRIIYLNRSLQRLLALDPEEALRQPVAKYFKDWDWVGILREQKVVSRDVEISYPEPRYLNFYLLPLYQEEKTAEKELLGYALIFYDVTDTRAKTQATIESEKINALTLLAAGVAHELGNPLNSLNIHFQLLERDLKKIEGARGQRLQDSVQVIRTEIARLDTIIQQFLSAVRPTEPQRELSQLNELVRESIQFLRPEIEDRDILVETELGGELPLMAVDRGQMKQVFYNIIKNAIQAMGTGGILRIESGRSDTHAMISFVDNGCGIAPEQVTRIFEPYFTTKSGGTGLGLLIVRRIVREHGGEVEMESHVGRGTTVRVLLPLQERRMRLLPASPEGGQS